MTPARAPVRRTAHDAAAQRIGAGRAGAGRSGAACRQPPADRGCDPGARLAGRSGSRAALSRRRELDRLQQAVSAEARRRGQLPAEGDAPDSGREDKETPGRATRPAPARKREPVPVTPGQERLIRAAYEAGLGPAAIAREFRVSRAQVERVIAAAGRRK